MHTDLYYDAKGVRLSYDSFEKVSKALWERDRTFLEQIPYHWSLSPVVSLMLRYYAQRAPDNLAHAVDKLMAFIISRLPEKVTYKFMILRMHNPALFDINAITEVIVVGHGQRPISGVSDPFEIRRLHYHEMLTGYETKRYEKSVKGKPSEIENIDLASEVEWAPKFSGEFCPGEHRKAYIEARSQMRKELKQRQEAELRQAIDKEGSMEI